MADLNEIVQLIKNGRKDQARQQLLSYLQTDRNNEQAWLYMAAVASNKTEFVKSVQRVLEINPMNRQALDLAEKYDIPVPEQEDAVPAGKKGRQKKAAKPAKKATAPKSEGRRRGCLMPLLLLILIAAVAGGAFIFLTGGDDGVDTQTIADGTANATSIAMTQAAAISGTALASAVDVTVEVPTLASAETQIAAASTAIGETLPPAPTPETAAGVDPQTTAEVASANPSGELVTSIEVRSAGEVQPTYGVDDPLEIAVELGQVAEPITLDITAAPQTGEAFTFAREIQPAPAQTLVIPIKTALDEWQAGVWAVTLTINGEEAATTTFEIEAAAEPTIAATATRTPSPEPTDTPRPTSTPTATPTEKPPFEEVTLSLVYDQDSAYLLNMSDQLQDVSTLRFVQGDRVFETMDWQEPMGSSRAAGSVYQMQQDSCFHVGITSQAASQKPIDCIRVSSWVPRPDQAFHFWLPANARADSFDIYQGETLLITCDLNASSCEFGLAAPE